MNAGENFRFLTSAGPSTLNDADAAVLIGAIPSTLALAERVRVDASAECRWIRGECREVPAGIGLSSCNDLAIPHALFPTQSTSLFDVSLCLSRACLGKMIIFIFKKIAQKKVVSLAPVVAGVHPLVADQMRTLRSRLRAVKVGHLATPPAAVALAPLGAFGRGVPVLVLHVDACLAREI
jgi:hypothetical protein